MTPHPAQHPPLRPATWVRVTTIGWFLGFLVMLLLIPLAEAILGPGESMVGTGMGAGLGFWQSRSLRGILPKPSRWTLASVVGLGTPFIARDVTSRLGVEGWYSLPAAMVVGGFILAIWQWRLLRPLSERAISWVAACTIGWTLPALAMALGDRYRAEPWGALLSLTAMFLGGAVLGAVTAHPLVWLLPGSLKQA